MANFLKSLGLLFAHHFYLCSYGEILSTFVRVLYLMIIFGVIFYKPKETIEKISIFLILPTFFRRKICSESLNCQIKKVIKV